jgi:organic radical activating enzyme
MNNNLIIEVDITTRCNLSCLYCNRLCNSERKYNIKRTKQDMTLKHIYYLCSEIRKNQKGYISMIRVLGGEPLLSPIIYEAINQFEKLKKEGYIKKINIVTNGTIVIPAKLEKYVVFSPIIISDLYKRNKPAPKDEIYNLKSSKHRNITIAPVDYNIPGKLCNSIADCGINYSVYGFSYTATCLPALIVFPDNHKYFIYYLPKSINELIPEDFENNVCSKCNFSFDKESYESIIKTKEIYNNIGVTWLEQIQKNIMNYKEPNTNWLNKI